MIGHIYQGKGLKYLQFHTVSKTIQTVKHLDLAVLFVMPRDIQLKLSRKNG